MTEKRRRAERAGRLVESWAAWRLLLTGHRVLARRYRSAAGEIDIIARLGRLLIFAEAKNRPTLDQAAKSVTPDQRRRVERAA
ncbi:MAG: YraN family protein [Rhodospirillaceae bacterium]